MATKLVLLSVLCVFAIFLNLSLIPVSAYGRYPLRFNSNGRFKMLQISDLHLGFGKNSSCWDVPKEEYAYCTDYNSTMFIQRTIASEKPDLIVFSGDNIYGLCESSDAASTMKRAFAPAIESGIPWIAILGNHDQESDLTREKLMEAIVKLPNTWSQVNPPDGWLFNIDGFGNYILEIFGPFGSPLFFKSLLNLYQLDGGDYVKGYGYSGFVYDWVKSSQVAWYEHNSKWLESRYKSWPFPQNTSAPGLVFLHIPLPEFNNFTQTSSNMVGVRQEDPCIPPLNSGLFAKLVERGDVKAVFSGHDHINDFCGYKDGIQLCYAGGAGYHTYGLAGWARRVRVIEAHLEKDEFGRWGRVHHITSWKRLDDKTHSSLDHQILWTNNLTLSRNLGFVTC